MLTRRYNTPFSLFDSLLSDPVWTHLETRSYSGLDCKTTEDGIEIRAVVPGYGREDLELSLEENVLTISSREKKPNVFHRLKISSNLDVDKVEAKCDKGILTITMPKLKPPEKEKRLLSIN